MKISLNLEVKKVNGGNIYQENSGRFVYLEDGVPVCFTTEKGKRFYFFEQASEVGDFIKILFQEEWRIFRKDNKKPVAFVNKRREVFYTFSKSLSWDPRAEEILFKEEWSIFDKETGMVFS